jgi:8-oxo-dGTP pyrophosphatase MutT (NUDIX family)
MGVTIRPQVGALPVRFDEDGTLEVLLITSRRSRKWIIPKGNLMKRLEPHHAAAREAFEEAGALGMIENRPRGHYRHRKRKARRRLRCRVAVYLMQVGTRLERFPERDERAVRWFTVDQARGAIRNRRLKELITRVSADLSPRRQITCRATRPRSG